MCIFVIFSDREYVHFSTFAFGLFSSYAINDQLSPLGTYFRLCLFIGAYSELRV